MYTYYRSMQAGVNLKRTRFVLNPSGDLKRTEKKFGPFFRKRGWEGVVGRMPSREEFREAIREAHLFLYMGHSGGERMVGGRAGLADIEASGVALLVGCSSARPGLWEGPSSALSYLVRSLRLISLDLLLHTSPAPPACRWRDVRERWG